MPDRITPTWSIPVPVLHDHGPLGVDLSVGGHGPQGLQDLAVLHIAKQQPLFSTASMLSWSIISLSAPFQRSVYKITIAKIRGVVNWGRAWTASLSPLSRQPIFPISWPIIRAADPTGPPVYDHGKEEMI